MSNEPLFRFRHCEIEVETVPQLEQGNLGGITFYDDAFKKSDSYIGKFMLQLDVQFIRDLLSFLSLKNLSGHLLESQTGSVNKFDNPEDNNQLELSPIKGVNLTLDNKGRSNESIESNPEHQRVTYSVKKVRFLLYRPTYSQFQIKLQDLLNTDRRFCNGAGALDYNGREVPPDLPQAERWSLLGGIRTCYPEDYEADSIIYKIKSHIVAAHSDYSRTGDDEALLCKFNDDAGYEQVKALIQALDI